MKYQKALSALHQYIANFDPEEFSSPPDFVPLQLLSSEKREEIQKIKTRLKRKRFLSRSLHVLFERNIPKNTEVIITQEEVDVLLEGWSRSEKK